MMAQARLQMVNLLLQQGRKDDAVAQLHDFVGAFPESPFSGKAKDLLKRLQGQAPIRSRFEIVPVWATPVRRVDFACPGTNSNQGMSAPPDYFTKRQKSCLQAACFPIFPAGLPGSVGLLIGISQIQVRFRQLRIEPGALSGRPRLPFAGGRCGCKRCPES